MKKHGGAIVFVVILMVVGFFFFKDELHIDIKNPFAGKSEVPDSVVEEMLAETTDSIGYSADEVTYTWEAKHTPDREQHQDTVELTLVCSGEYGAVTFKRAQTYQYYKENDIWDVCESGDLETTDIQWDLKKLLDGKTYTKTYTEPCADMNNGASYTVTLSDLDLNAMTVTATYSYSPARSKYNNRNYYVTNLKGQEVNKLTGTVECHIKQREGLNSFGGLDGGFEIQEIVGSLWLDADYLYGDWGADVAVYLDFNDPISCSGVGVGPISELSATYSLPKSKKNFMS